MTDQLVTVPSSFVQIGPARINVTAEFHHPRDSFTTGQLHAEVQSDQVNLSQLAALQKQWPNTKRAMRSSMRT